MPDNKTTEVNEVTVEFTGIIVHGPSARELAMRTLAAQMSYLDNLGIGSNFIKKVKDE